MLRRRCFIKSLCRTAAVFSLDQIVQGTSLGVQFVNVAREAGLRAGTIFGGKSRNRYLLETTGCGVAFFDYDNDGWLDIFLVNGTRFEADWAKGSEPIMPLYKNNRDGTFTDVTQGSGLARTGWGQGCLHRAITITTATTTCWSLTGAIACCTTITATANSRM